MPTCSSMCTLPPRDSVQMGWSGFRTSTPSTSEMSLAVMRPSPSLSRRTTLGFASCILSRTSFRLRTMSVTSSTTSGSVVNSCSALSIFTAVIAAPCSDERRMRRSEFPSVVPKPRSSGSHTNLPKVSVRSSSSSIRGRIRSRQFLAMSACCVGVAIAVPCSLAVLLRVELDDELLANRQRDVVASREHLHLALEAVLRELEPLRHTAPLDGAERVRDARHLLRRFLHVDRVIWPDEIRRNVHPAAVDLEVSMANELARLGVVRGEAETVDDVVQATLEELDEVLAGHALHARGLEVVAAELALGDAVDALHLLLLAQLLAVVGRLAAARLAMLARRIRAALVAALVGVAAVALEEELHVL